MIYLIILCILKAVWVNIFIIVDVVVFLPPSTYLFRNDAIGAYDYFGAYYRVCLPSLHGVLSLTRLLNLIASYDNV